MAEKLQHKLFNEHIYEGIPLAGVFPVRVIDKIKDVDLCGDILLASYPKTGTTWMQELLWLVHTEGDFQSANTVVIDKRVPFLELDAEGIPSLEETLSMPHPRLIKTHMQASIYTKQLARQNIKVILQMRNPKDTLVSFYHFYRANSGMGNFSGSWDEYFDQLVKTKNLYCGDYFSFYKGWLQYQDNPNVKIIHYEDMKQNLRDVVQDVANFLNKTLEEDLLHKILDHLSFSQMRSNNMTNYFYFPYMDLNISLFMRKGEVGDWKNYFNKEQDEFIDLKYIEFQKETGIQLKFEL